jgi:hypothetical protein
MRVMDAHMLVEIEDTSGLVTEFTQTANTRVLPGVVF